MDVPSLCVSMWYSACHKVGTLKKVCTHEFVFSSKVMGTSKRHYMSARYVLGKIV